MVYAMAPHHPLATVPEPLTDDVIRQHRAVAVADSVQRGSGLTFGLLAGQDVFTVPNMAAKLEAQLRGIGSGFTAGIHGAALFAQREAGCQTHGKVRARRYLQLCLA
jgi:hypothetical protein